MKLLAWDTSSKVGALVALEWDQDKRGLTWDDVRLVGEWTLNVTATHSERLLWGIHQLLESAQWKIADVDLFAVGVGPGSFTGLRIGLTTARSLAHSLNKSLIPVSSLAALARPAAIHLGHLKFSKSLDLGRTMIVAATDACKGELFTLYGSARSVRDCVCIADGDRQGIWKRGVEERVETPEALIKLLTKKLNSVSDEEGAGYWLAVGEGRRRYPELWESLPAEKEIQAPFSFSDHVQGRYLGQLAWEAFQFGLSREPLSIHPRYIRASDAEMKLKAGLLRPAPTRTDL
jgi:tRNA threonylcarbamoyl adenosine modification protein YeaZ